MEKDEIIEKLVEENDQLKAKIEFLGQLNEDAFHRLMAVEKELENYQKAERRYRLLQKI